MTEPKKGTHDRQWKKGESGNPAGRPPGSSGISKNRALISEHVPEIIAKLVEQAKAGDTTSARLLLERAIPSLKPSEELATLTLSNGTLTEQGRAVLAAAGCGQLAPGQAAQFLTAIATLTKIVETDELAARVAALEDKANGKTA